MTSVLRDMPHEWGVRFMELWHGLSCLVRCGMNEDIHGSLTVEN